MLKVAETSNQRQKHAAMIMMNGNPIAIGINTSRNDPKFVNADCPIGEKADIYSTHAERAAIRRAGSCEGGVLYVVRQARGDAKLSMPCERCMLAIMKAGIKRVIFSTDTGIGIIKV